MLQASYQSVGFTATTCIAEKTVSEKTTFVNYCAQAG